MSIRRTPRTPAEATHLAELVDRIRHIEARATQIEEEVAAHYARVDALKIELGNLRRVQTDARDEAHDIRADTYEADENGDEIGWSDPLGREVGDVLVPRLPAFGAAEVRVLDIRKQAREDGIYSAEYRVELVANREDLGWIPSVRFERR